MSIHPTGLNTQHWSVLKQGRENEGFYIFFRLSLVKLVAKKRNKEKSFNQTSGFGGIFLTKEEYLDSAYFPQRVKEKKYFQLFPTKTKSTACLVKMNSGCTLILNLCYIQRRLWKQNPPVGISLHPFLKIKSINLISQSGEKQRREESYLLSLSLQIIQFSSDSADWKTGNS